MLKLVMAIAIAFCQEKGDVPELVVKESQGQLPENLGGLVYGTKEYFRGDVKILRVSKCTDAGHLISTIYAANGKQLYSLNSREDRYFGKSIYASNCNFDETDADLDGKHDF